MVLERNREAIACLVIERACVNAVLNARGIRGGCTPSERAIDIVPEQVVDEVLFDVRAVLAALTTAGASIPGISTQEQLSDAGVAGTDASDPDGGGGHEVHVATEPVTRFPFGGFSVVGD